IQLRSQPGEGSIFTLFLPQTYVGPSASVAGSRTDKSPASTVSPLQLTSVNVVELPVERIPDDRETLQDDDAVLLIVEDDPHYARALKVPAREKGFKVLAAMRGAEALALAREFPPPAISLDVFLPDMMGWTVLNPLKQDPATRHIPVQVLTL